MKSRITVSLLAFFLFLLLACHKETSNMDQNGNSPVKDVFSATIGSKQWSADSSESILVGPNGISITGVSKTGDQISIILSAFQTGTYTLNTQTLSYAVYGNVLTNGINAYVSNSGNAGGTVIISAIDSLNHLVSGTFQLSLVNPADNSSATIAKGIFNDIPYTVGSGGVSQPVGNGNTDTLTATIDGVKFISTDISPSITNGQLLIAGFSTGGTQDIGLLMPPDIQPGSYPLDFATGLYIGIYNPSPTITLISQASGTLTIIANDTVSKKIKGTFDFTASPTGSGTPAVITAGYFSLNY